MVHQELHQPQSDASWTSENETRHASSVFWQNASCTQACRFSTFLRRGFSFPLALLAFAMRLYRFSTSGWLSQASAQKASTRCENFQLLPMLSPSAPVVPLVANTDANSLEVRPDVSASKIPRMFSCRKSLLMSAFQAFSAWPTFEYCKVNRRVQFLMVSPQFRRRESSLKKSS